MSASTRKTLAIRLEELQISKQKPLQETFADHKITYPPKVLKILALKKEKKLEIHAGNDPTNLKKILEWPILAASGHAGPKLREGDRQVPEGIYHIDFLNPNSIYHLALKLNYPNEFDRLKAQSDNRYNLGNNIMIHGNQVSKSCLAIGDEKIEQLFLLAADTGLANIRVIIAPMDFRIRPIEEALSQPELPEWTNELYSLINEEFKTLK